MIEEPAVGWWWSSEYGATTCKVSRDYDGRLTVTNSIGRTILYKTFLERGLRLIEPIQPPSRPEEEKESA